MAETREGGVYKVGRGDTAKYVDANGKEVAAPTKQKERGDTAGQSKETEIPYADLLAAKGFTTAAQIRSASDDDLLGEGIGPARLREIRAATQE